MDFPPGERPVSGQGSTVGWEGFPGRLQQVPGFAGHTFAWVETIGSTNDVLKNDWRVAGSGAGARFVPRVLVAGHQTAGRGQYGRTWEDRPGTGLLVSFSWRVAGEDTAGAFPWTLRAGLALWRTLVPRLSGCWLKWPNDLWLGERKAGGILVEGAADERGLQLVVGIGLNLRAGAAIAGGVALTDGVGRMDEAVLLENILRQWSTLAADRDSARLAEEFRQAGQPLWGRAVEVEWADGPARPGWARGLASDGALEVEFADGTWGRIASARRLRLGAPA